MRGEQRNQARLAALGFVVVVCLFAGINSFWHLAFGVPVVALGASPASTNSTMAAHGVILLVSAAVGYPTWVAFAYYVNKERAATDTNEVPE